MCRVILVTQIKMERLTRQASYENVTGVSTGTFLVAIRRRYPSPRDRLISSPVFIIN